MWLNDHRFLESGRHGFEFLSDINLVSLRLSFHSGEIALFFFIFQDGRTD